MADDDDAVSVPEELVTYIANTAGRNLRGVAHYDADTFAFELRESVDAAYDEAALRAIVDDMRVQDRAKPAHERLFSVGDLYCTLRAFDDAIMLHFPQDDERGTVVSLLPDAAPQLTDFIYDTLAVLDRHSEQEIRRAPSWQR
ncbi:hypothetical protein [Halobaculum lipolyticum]|uniref:Uncharacterized protein n=1 Tax=Halobaculum lipolyticum TaxID=3032001 RepID=A0ABD5WAP0_9EURY|nr:hypothetical protein [Halobaculum sp. DT31]